MARRQLRELGLSDDSVDRRLGAGRLHPVFRGVYAVGHTALPHLGRTQAAVLACGTGAVLSHRSAAELWALLRTSRYVIDVTVPRRIRGQTGIRVHFGSEVEKARHQGIPVTSVAQTLFDLARTEPTRQLRRAWDQAERLQLLDLEALTRFRRSRPLTALIAEARTPEPTRSELEDVLRDLCHAYGIPIPAFNVVVAGEDVDAYWPAHGLVVELDGWEHHKTRRDRERDLLKEERVKLAGHPFMRFTYDRVANSPHEVAAVLSKCLDMPPMLRGSLPG